MKVKVSEASVPVLDWMVSKCEGMDDDMLCMFDMGEWLCGGSRRYTRNWVLGGPIIERENITVGVYHDEYGKTVPNSWQAYIGWEPDLLDPTFQVDGPTPLIAAMRCYVASKLGDTIEIPEELKS